MSEAEQPVHQPQLQESNVTEPHADVHEQATSENPMISVESSEEFRNIDVSRSQDLSGSFNNFTDSKTSENYDQLETSEQKPSNHTQKQPEPQTKQESQPEKPKQQPKEEKPKDQTKPKEVDYEGMVSLKIFEKKINQSLDLKNQGNQFYKANQYPQAIKKYSQGLTVLDPQQFYGATQAECQKMAEVSASLLYNIGMCFFNSNSWKQAEIYFNQTIMINPNHIKALHRRALSRYHLQNYEEAMNDIKQAFNKDRRNAEVHESYEKILKMYNEQLKKEKESMKEISSKIFRKQSQNSVNLSPEKEQKQEKSQQNEEKPQEKPQENAGQEEPSLWGLAPLVLVAGAALFFGYKKFFK